MAEVFCGNLPTSDSPSSLTFQLMITSFNHGWNHARHFWLVKSSARLLLLSPMMAVYLTLHKRRPLSNNCQHSLNS